MRNIFFFLIFFSVIACKNSGTSESKSLQHYMVIDSLLQVNEYFAARDIYSETKSALLEYHRLLAGAGIDNVFNRLEASNRKIDSLFEYYGRKLPDKEKYRLLRTRQMNHSKLFEYKEANDVMHEMLTNYKTHMKDEDVKDYQNTKKIWAALALQPAQQLTINDNTTLKLKRDKLGLQNLELRLGSMMMDFIFDTGANFSTVTESTAKKLKMQFMDTTVIDVGSITGKEVRSRIGICPSFNLGNITVKNAVFLVFPDEALAIPQIPFQINGIIGFPVIEAMNEVQLTRNGDFFVPKQGSAFSEQNLALDFLTPVIRLNGESFTFDSGASSTMLYDNYFTKHKNGITANYTETDITIGGAGGNITKKGYIIPFKTEVNGKVITLDSVQLFKEKIKDDNYFAGNIGQDLIQQFEKMTINFESMFVRFD